MLDLRTSARLRTLELGRAGGALLLGGLLLLVGGLAIASARGAEDPAPVIAAPVQPVTVLLVRHAEKDPQGDPKDPGLSDVGRKRAEALADLCAASGVTHLFASEFRRTRETLAPLAGRLGLEVRVVPAGQPAELVRAIEALPAGSVVLVAGHSNTVPDLAARLGGELHGLVTSGAGRMLPDDAYDRLAVVTRPAADARSAVAVSTLELRYGR